MPPFDTLFATRFSLAGGQVGADGTVNSNIIPAGAYRFKVSLHSGMLRANSFTIRALRFDAGIQRLMLVYHFGIPHFAQVDLTPSRSCPGPTWPPCSPAPAGTVFDPEDVKGLVEGNMGDVIGVDLKEPAAKQLLVKEKKLSAEDVTRPH